MPDRLTIHDLAVECRIGVPEWERAKPQPIWIDIEAVIDAAKAARRDDVREAVDYARLATQAAVLAKSKSYRLLETLADELAGMIVREFRVPKVVVRVKKRALPGIDYAAVEVERDAVLANTRRRSGRSPTRAPRSPGSPAKRRS